MQLSEGDHDDDSGHDPNEADPGDTVRRAFVMGCAEMLVVGLIDLIADDLSVSLPAAGALVTATALGVAIGGPLLTFLTTRVTAGIC